MRYHVLVRAWRQGEYEARLEEIKTSQGGSFTSRDADPICRSQTREYTLDTESEEEALTEAKDRYAQDGLPPESEWGNLSLACATPVPYLTIRELLTAPVLRSDFALWGESPVEGYDYVDWRAVEAEKRVRKDYYANPYIDGRRTWELAIVYFDNKPAYVSQNAGREGRDHKATFLISRDTKAALIAYLRTKMEDQEPEEEEWPLDKESIELTCFYSNSLGEILQGKP